MAGQRQPAYERALNADFSSLGFDSQTFKESCVRGPQIWVPPPKCAISANVNNLA